MVLKGKMSKTRYYDLQEINDIHINIYVRQFGYAKIWFLDCSEISAALVLAPGSAHA